MEIEPQSVQKSIKFIKAASDTVKERGVTREFTCPLCGGLAKATRAEDNGHLHAVCTGCKMSIME